jgi:membrane-bound lytic murein transglycosylase D
MGITILLLAVKLFSFSSRQSDDKEFQDEFNARYKVFSLNIPKDLNFAGEMVPINNFDVRESMDRELLLNTYFQSQTILLHKRANRWFPVIEPILKKNGVPADFKYIALIESNLSNIVSPAGATGFWQFIESTGKNYGLEINDEVDERYNVEKSTQAACRYFKDAYKQFNNWTLVAASYNLGLGGITAQLENQKVDNYYNLLLNQETARYIFRLLAVKEVISNPKAYGYTIRKKDLYPFIPTYEVKLDSAVSNFTDYAIANEVNYKILKLFNPWLRKSSLSNVDKKTYIIRLPKKGFTNYDMLESTINNSYSSEDSMRFFHSDQSNMDSLPDKTN